SFLQPVDTPQFDVQLATVPAEGGAPTVITGGMNGANDIGWSPLLIDAGAGPLLGDNGPLGAGTAAGLIYSQSGEKVRSVLAFDTAVDTVDSRAKTEVIAESLPSSPVQVFLIATADGLGRVAYSNFDSATGKPGPVVVPSLPAGIPTAVVVI